MFIFSKLKLIYGAIALGVLAYIKYLRATNEEQKENINRLGREIAVRKEVSEDKVKRAIFDSKQKVRAEELKKSEIKLDEIEKEAKENEENPNSEFAADDNFVPVRM